MKSSTDRPAGEARAAAGGQDVVGPGDIIADRLGRVAAEEHRSGMADAVEQRLRIVAPRVRDARARGGRPAASPRRASATTMIAPLASQRSRATAAGGERRRAARSTAAATASAKAASSVNRIDWLVGSCSAWLSRSAAIQSGSFAPSATTTISLGPGDHVDADHAVELALGLGDPGVAGAGDHVDRRDPPGAIGERGDRLRAADRARPRRRPAMCAAASTSGLTSPSGVGVTITSRSTPATLAGIAFISTERGIGRAAAGHVEPGRIDRAPARAEADAGRVGRRRCPSGFCVCVIGARCARRRVRARRASSGRSAVVARRAQSARLDPPAGLVEIVAVELAA